MRHQNLIHKFKGKKIFQGERENWVLCQINEDNKMPGLYGKNS